MACLGGYGLLEGKVPLLPVTREYSRRRAGTWVIIQVRRGHSSFRLAARDALLVASAILVRVALDELEEAADATRRGVILVQEGELVLLEDIAELLPGDRLE